MKLRCILVAAVAATLAANHLPAQTPAPDLQTILNRAADYVAAYEDRELGNVLAAETWVQQLSLFRRPGFPPVPARTVRTESDFLIILLGTDRVGARKVNLVDGQPAKSSEKLAIETLTDNSAQGIRKRLAALNQESSRYNLGPVFGQINLPIFALRVLRRKDAPRFRFEREGNSRIDGVQTVEIRFQEVRAPTLVHSQRGESLLSSGRVWIEPSTGRVLKTELDVANPEAKTKGRVTVTYAANKTLGILVPVEQREHYEAPQGYVDGKATYSRFRSFNVDVKSEIASPPKQK